MKSVIDWRIFRILLALSLISILAVLPYVLTIQGETLRQLNVSLAVLIPVQLLQSAVLFTIAIFLGLVLARKTGFRLPILEAIVAHTDFRKPLRGIPLASTLLGIGTAVAIYTLDLVFTGQGAGISTHQNLAPVWQKLLAALYGGISEEILLRLFLMSLFVWVGMRITGRGKPTPILIVTSIFLAAVIFGLGHLPITAAVTAITPIVVMRAIILNGIGGVVFGWLYWKKGLEAAIIAHFTADIFLLTVLPIILQH